MAEDTDGALMLTTSDPAASREAFAALGLPYEQHTSGSGVDPGLPGLGAPGRGG